MGVGILFEAAVHKKQLSNIGIMRIINITVRRRHDYAYRVH